MVKRMKEWKTSARQFCCVGFLLLIGTAWHSARGAAGDVDLTFDPGSGVNGPVHAVVLQPAGKMIIGGSFTTVKGVACQNIARLNADGSGDVSFAVSVPPVRAIVAQPGGKLLVAHSGGILRLNTDGTFDTNFTALAVLYGNGLSASVEAIALQSDGKILIGGAFTIVGNQFLPALARLNSNGTLDPTLDTSNGFKQSQIEPSVTHIVVQPDGKVIAAGQFEGYSDALRTNVVRIYADGHLDYGFVPSLSKGLIATALALQPDGKVLVSQLTGSAYAGGIVRLNTNGTQDITFTSPTGGYGIEAVTLQSDGKVLVGGSFSALNGIARDLIARLNADGSVDNSFDPGPPPHTGARAIAVQTNGKIILGGGPADPIANGSYLNVTRLNPNGSADGTFVAGGGVEGNVVSVAPQADGKTLIAGLFKFVNGMKRDGLARLNPNGSLDETFLPDATVHFPVQVKAQSDGRALLSGYSTSVTGAVARLNVNGSRDNSFNVGSGADGTINLMELQPDGKILIAGGFSSVNGTNRNGLARLNSDGSLDNGFVPTISPISSVGAIAAQPDGKALISGTLWFDGDTNIYGLVRLKADGVLDGTFQQQIWDPNLDLSISRIVLQPNGKIVISGIFNSILGTTRYGIASLRADGSVDPTFDAGEGLRDQGGGPMALQPNGKILVGGWYNLGNNDYLAGVFRLNTNGTLDASFAAPNAGNNSEGVPSALALQPEGNIIIGGAYRQYANIVRYRVTRLYGDFARPTLSIARSSGSAVLSWPAAFGNYQLQSSTNISISNGWSSVAGARSTNNGFISVMLLAPGSGKFFRLSSQ
jgi:uncharacterized delta-60 repeat protein